MQKISSYLYSNRIELLADLATFNVEYTNVYQRIIKIYNGIDNVIEFDIKNADQKRIDLSTLSYLQLNLMDSSGNALPGSPYPVDPIPAMRGIATVVIPKEDLDCLTSQFFRYSVTAVKNGQDVLLYGDTRFGAVGKMELVGSAVPTIRAPRVYDTFTAEIDLQGVPIFHSPAIPARFYEAVPTTSLDFYVNVKGFVGTIWLEATKAGTISAESFRAAGKPFGSWNHEISEELYTGIVPYGLRIPVGDYTYFRLSFQTPSMNGYGADFKVIKSNNQYTVTIKTGGTGYTAGSVIRVPGSQLGGTDTINDLYITVNGVLGSSSTMASSYTMSSINTIIWLGTASEGTATYIVSGSNYSGTVDNVTVE